MKSLVVLVIVVSCVSLLDCMEVLSKGVHRAMVPVDGQAENVEKCVGQPYTTN